jgi:hypothetical protein
MSEEFESLEGDFKKKSKILNESINIWVTLPEGSFEKPQQKGKGLELQF